ncbi:transmembrane and tetratricopeptide repeat containing 1 [Chamberlinius hualienensis]
MIGGLEPIGFHLINVILHTVVVLLFTCVCRRCFLWPNHVTLTASVLMATHPIHTEAVAGIVGRADVLACALSILSFLFYIRSLEDEKLRMTTLAPPKSMYFYISFAMASLAMLAKEHGVTILAIVAMYDAFVSEKKIRRAIKNWIAIPECYPFITRVAITVLVTLVLITFRIWMLDGTVPQFSEQDNPASFAVLWQTRFLTYAYLLAFNAWLLLGPITMSYDWQLGSIPLVETLWDIRNVSTVLLAVLLLLLIWRVLISEEENDQRVMYVGLLFIIFPFLPASNLFVTVGFVVAERILYFPSIGFCILVAHGFHKLSSHRKWRRLAVWSLIILIVAFAMKTLLRNRVWNSRETLFKSGLETLPHNAKMHYNFANLQNDLGNVQEAIKHYKETLRLWPEHASAQNNLGTLVEDALVAKFHFMEAIRINPSHARAHFNMGNLLSKESQMPTAIRFMEQAVVLEPTYTDAYTNLAAMYSEVGRYEDAERVHRSLLQLEPDSADVHNNYGAFLQKIGRKDESLKSYKQSTAIQPDHLVALVNTAKLLRSMKKNVEAEEIYKKVMEMKEDPKVMDSLGLLYLSTGRYDEAKKIFNDLLTKFPDELDARVHFAQSYTHEMNFGEAEEMLQWVLSRNASHRDGLRQMALLCNHLNRTTEALDYILRALKLCSVGDVACAQLYADHATIMMDRDHMDLAMESYKMALQVYPSFTLAHLNLGVIYHIKRDFTQAWSHYKTAQVLEPNNRLLQENMDKLRKAEIALTSSSEHADSCR